MAILGRGTIWIEERRGTLGLESDDLGPYSAKLVSSCTHTFADTQDPSEGEYVMKASGKRRSCLVVVTSLALGINPV